jgi:hypothetical protein
MDEEKFDFWLEAYGRAWENRDPAAAAELFSENATYRETPFDEPARGREAIFDYWARATAGQDGVRFGHEVLMVDSYMGSPDGGRRSRASGWARPSSWTAYSSSVWTPTTGARRSGSGGTFENAHPKLERTGFGETTPE